MTRVYFVRHAKTDYRNPVDRDRVLTPEGMQDRYLARDFLISQHLEPDKLHLFSSHFKRAVDTLQPFADHVGLPIQIDEDFREWTVIAPEEAYYEACRRAWEDFTYRYKQCETLEEVQQRNVRKLMELTARYPDETILIGSHGTALSTVIHYFNPDYGYPDLIRTMEIKPWIVRFDFEENRFLRYEEVFPSFSSNGKQPDS